MFGVQATRWISAILGFTVVTLAQNLPDPSTCQNPQQSFSGCQVLKDKSSSCGSISPDNQADLIACFCTQAVFNAIVDCESEVRQCQRTDTGDADFQDILDAWKVKCQPKINFTPTTPVLATYTSDPGIAFCQHVDLACASLQSKTDSCSSQYSDSTAISSCQCQTDVLAAASVCEVDGGSCLGETILSSTLFSNRYCATEAAVTTPSNASTGSQATPASNAGPTTAANTAQTGASVSNAAATFVPTTASARTLASSSPTSKSGAASLCAGSLEWYLLALIGMIVSLC